MLLVPRTVWQERGFEVTGPALYPAQIEAITAHYPGGNPGPLDSDAQCIAYLRRMQRDYVDNRGYSLGYSWMIPPRGGAWESRGFDLRNAANGSSTWNLHTVSVQFAVPIDGDLSPQQIQTAQDLHAYVESRTGRQIVWNAHGQVRNRVWPDLAPADAWTTDCPGPHIWRRLQAGEFLAPPPAPEPTPDPTPPPVPDRKGPALRLIQPWDGLTPDPAILLEVGGPSGVCRWLPTGSDVDAAKLAGATTEPRNGDPWPVPRSALARLILVGPAPRYDVNDPNRTKTKASDFFQ